MCYVKMQCRAGPHRTQQGARKEKWPPPELLGPLPGDFLLLPLPRGPFLPPLRSLYPVRARACLVNRLSPC